MGSFNPADAQIRVGHETLPGILPAAWHDHLFTSESLANERTTIELDSIVANSQAAEPLPSTIETNGDIEVELDAEGHLAYLVNAQRQNSTTEPVTDAFLHKLAPSETAEAAPDTLQNEVWRADDLGQLFQNGRVNEMTVELEQGEVAKATFGMLYGRSSYFADTTVAEDGATPNTSIPQLRGLPRYNNWLNSAAAADRRVHIKITDITDIGSGTIVARAKTGGGAYGVGATFEIVGGLDSNGNPRWNEVKQDSGLPLGERDTPIEIFIQSLTGQEVDDAYSWDAERAVWVQAIPDVPVFNTVFAAIYLGAAYDERICIQGITLTLTRPVEPQLCLGGAYPDSIQERGQRVVNWAINRDYLDTNLRKRLETGEPVGIRADLFSGVEFETGHEHYMSFISSRVIFRGRTASVASKSEMPEELEGQAFPNPGESSGNVDDLTIYVKNSIEDPNA